MLGRPLAYYPIYAAKLATKIDAIYVSTDCPEIQKVARNMDIQIIDRPAELSQDQSELVDAIIHAMKLIGDDLKYLVTMQFWIPCVPRASK